MDGSQRNEADAEKSLRAAEKDTEAVGWARLEWLAETSRIDPAQLIFLGESGVTTEMTRRYDRARALAIESAKAFPAVIGGADRAGRNRRLRMGGDDGHRVSY